jgi:hypothetical protein
MRIHLVAAGILVTLISAGCGGPADSAPPPAQEPPSTEQALQQRAEAAVTALNAGDWLGLHELLSPRIRQAKFPFGLEAVQTCPPNQFILEMVTGLADLRAQADLDQEAVLTWSVIGVTVDDKEIGQVYLTVSHDGDPLDSGGNQIIQRWMVRDAEWWHEEEDWRDGCPKLGSGEEAAEPDAQGNASES